MAVQEGQLLFIAPPMVEGDLIIRFSFLIGVGSFSSLPLLFTHKYLFRPSNETSSSALLKNLPVRGN